MQLLYRKEETMITYHFNPGGAFVRRSYDAQEEVRFVAEGFAPWDTDSQGYLLDNELLPEGVWAAHRDEVEQKVARATSK